MHHIYIYINPFMHDGLVCHTPLRARGLLGHAPKKIE